MLVVPTIRDLRLRSTFRRKISRHLKLRISALFNPYETNCSANEDRQNLPSELSKFQQSLRSLYPDKPAVRSERTVSDSV